MLSQEDGFGYNERLFSGGIRTWIHTARFRWLVRALKNSGCTYETVLELGSYDGKLIDFLPQKPKTYKGFDADWENGLELAAKKWGGKREYSFHKALKSADMCLSEDERYDIGVSMETIEHIPPEAVRGYLKTLSEHLDGPLFLTVPNEKGPVFFFKWLAKSILTKDTEVYKASEVFYATLGKMEKVKRGEHKGFDYDKLLTELDEYFDIRSVTGHPFSFLPKGFCFGIGVVALPKKGRFLSNNTH